MMIIESSYSDYSNSLSDVYNSSVIYRGQYIAQKDRQLVNDEKSYWILWDYQDGVECCQINQKDSLTTIEKILSLPTFLTDNQYLKIIKNSEDVLTWLNLCYFKDCHGSIIYDQYYDQYPILDSSSEVSILNGDFRTIITNLLTSYFPFEQGDTVILDGKLREYNFLIYLMRGLNINTVIAQNEDFIISSPNLVSRCTDKICVYFVGANSTMVERMPLEKEVRVYTEQTDVDFMVANNKFQIWRVHSDMLGNVWISAQQTDGTISTEHRVHSQVDYSVIHK